MRGRRPGSRSGAVVARLPLQSLDPFLRNDRSHEETGDRVGPPKAEQSVEQQSGKKDAGQIRTKFRPFGIRVHGRTAQRTTHVLLGSREQRHDDRVHTNCSEGLAATT